jgi:hypothetical protein
MLALLYRFGGLFDFLLIFVSLFLILFGLIFNLQRRMRFAVFRTWNGDPFGFECLFNLGQLLDEGGELFDVERDSLGKVED